MAVAQVYDPVAGATVDQQALYEYMSYLSEDCYCAGWMEGTEAACWEAVVNGGTRLASGSLPQRRPQNCAGSPRPQAAGGTGLKTDAIPSS
jgi:hypothetical protein